MKGDFSRFTFDRRKHYTGVRLQQGRVQLDADWNEQLDIAAYLRQTLARDLIGVSGAPTVGGGFEIKVDANQERVRVTPGRYWVDGLLCENDAAADLPLDEQPDLPGVSIPSRPNAEYPQGWYAAYLDVWERHVTALEDSDLLELALGGPDTATRSRTVWQVRLLRLGNGPFTCADFPLAAAPPRPTLAARTVHPPQENQLYRVEVHTPGTLDEATFKWSRDNGSVAALIERPGADPSNPETLVATRQIGPDQGGGFGPDQLIEVTDENRLLHGTPGTLARLADVSAQELKVESWPPPGTPPSVSGQPVIRRWDSSNTKGEPVRQTANDGFIALEEGLEVRFSLPAGARFVSGDYWTIPVRAAAGALWPQAAGGPAERPPEGIVHHYAPLALLIFDNTGWRPAPGQQCRRTFTASTAGIGQEKLNRTQNDTMTASLTITGDLTVLNNVTFGGASGTKKLTLLGMPLAPATGDGDQAGIQFPTLPASPSGDAAGFVRFFGTAAGSRFSSPRLLLGVSGPQSSIALRTDATEALTVFGGNVGIGTGRPTQKLHVEGGALFRPAGSVGVVVESSFSLRDGSQGTGRFLVSDANGRGTWRETPLNIGAPVFVNRFPVSSGGGPTGWIRYALPGDLIPAGIRAVILEAEAAKAGPDSGAIDAYIAIRRTAGASEDLLMRARAAGGGDAIAWSNQGMFPVKSDNSFEFAILGSGFDGGWILRVIGYFP